MNAKEMVDVVAAVVQLLFPDADIVSRETSPGHWWLDAYAGPEDSFRVQFRVPDMWSVSPLGFNRDSETHAGVFSEPSSLIAWLVRNRK